MTESEVIPPNSILIEKSVLSCCLQEKALFFKLLSEGVSEDYFFDGLCKAVFTSLQKLSDEEGAFDVILVIHECQNIIKEGESDKLDGEVASKVMKLRGVLSVTQSFDKYASELKQLHWQRKAFFHASDILSGKDLPNTDELEKSLSDLATEIQTSRISGKTKTSKNMANLLEGFVEEFREKYSNKELPGMSTGIKIIDDVTGGLRNTQFWIIGGATSSGKSALALQMSLSALKQDKRVGIVSLEMSGESIIGRMISASEGIDYDIIYNPHKYQLTKGQLKQMKYANERFMDFKLEVNDEGQVKMEDIDGVVADMEKNGDLDMLVIDHMHLLSADQTENKRHLELSKISGLGKAIAMKKNIPVVMPCQLNEDGKIRDSRAIADDPDVILFIRGNHIWLEKNRNGMRYIELPLQLVGNRMLFMTPLTPT